MNFLIPLIVFISSFSLIAAELEVYFKTSNLPKNEANLTITMESSNPLCAKVVVGIGGIAIGNRYQFLDGEIEFTGDELITRSNYSEGGFCQYKLSELYLYFIRGKNTYFETRISILNKEEWSGGGLDFLELSTNQNSVMKILCKGSFTKPLSMCVTTRDNEPRARGNAGSLYIWRESLGDFNRYNGGQLIFMEKM